MYRRKLSPSLVRTNGRSNLHNSRYQQRLTFFFWLKSCFIIGAAIHSFLMFAPFFALYEKKGMVVQGLFLFLFGPHLAGMITPNLMEQASIWCFFSIAQISIMLFFIRETLIINWVKDSCNNGYFTHSLHSGT
jgi:hypothetical protein